jgi:hypothetical protein
LQEVTVELLCYKLWAQRSFEFVEDSHPFCKTWRSFYDKLKALIAGIELDVGAINLLRLGFNVEEPERRIPFAFLYRLMMWTIRSIRVGAGYSTGIEEGGV